MSASLEVWQLFQAVTDLIEFRFAKNGLKDRTYRQVLALHAIGVRGSSNQQAIGDAIGMDRSTAAVLFKALEKKGLLMRKRSKTDGRERILTLTALGSAVAVKGIKIVNDVDAVLDKTHGSTTMSQIAYFRKLAQDERQPRRASAA